MNCHVRLVLSVSLFFLFPAQLLAAPEKEYALIEPAVIGFADDHYPRNAPELRKHLHFPEQEQTAFLPKRTVRTAHRPAAPDRKVTLPQYHKNLSFDDIAALRNVSMFHIKASIRLQNRIRERRLKLIDYIFADADGDGKLDIVTLSQKTDAKNRTQLVLGVYSVDEQFNPVLRYEKSQIVRDDSSQQQYFQRIAADKKAGFTFCEDWKIASWDVVECHDLLFSPSWIPGVQAHSVTTSEAKAHSSQTNRFDFKTKLASRSYERLPDGPFMPALRRQNEYAMIFAPLDETLSASPHPLTPTQSAAFPSTDHPPIRYDIRWNSSGIHMSFVLTDEDLEYTSSCSDQISVQQSDHLELWFDLNPSLNIKRDSPQSWMLEYEKEYQNEPYRHSIDSDIFGLAVLPGGCIVPMAPTRNNWHTMPEISVQHHAGGYRVDIYIPSKFYQAENMLQFDRSLGLGFTARQHDIHSDRPYDSLATSEWQWPDPFTFGQIWLLGRESAWPPPFPLQWNTWLIDN
ncbi:MAG: hypothetical protein IJM59_12320 [Proteobacteria bacterium]|nr:hypothetical protein [Pseudomonadota bacterium]